MSILGRLLGRLCGDAPPPTATVAPETAPGTGADVAQFCCDTPQLAAELGDSIDAKPLVGGLVNDVFVVSGSRGKLLVKRSGPTLRTAPDISIDLVRAGRATCHVPAAAAAVHAGNHVPAHAVQVPHLSSAPARTCPVP